MYFFENEYLVSGRKQPYLSEEKIKQHNLFVKDVEKMTKRVNETETNIDKRNSSIAQVVGLVPAVIFYLYYLSNYWQENLILGSITLLIPSLWIFGLGYMVVYGLAGFFSKNNSELESLESAIKEKIAHLDNELRLFEDLKKQQAQHWLSMNGWQFEKEVAKLYEAHGYSAVVTKGSDDGGIDIFLTKDGNRFGVQCKNYHKPVAQVVIRELAGAMLHENLDGGIVIASSGYTKRAKEFAENKPIKLLDINDVLRMHASTVV